MKKVIFDTDLGVDDAMALLFLHAHPSIDLIGVCSGVGNALVELTTRNCLYMQQRFGISAPVYLGEGVGLDGTNPLPPPALIHGENGIGNIDLPDAIPALSTTLSAADYMIKAVTEQPHELTIITVGRLTNLALALRRAPEIAPLIKEVIVMGGALGRHGHGGNISPVAEANVYGDPLAADEVFSSEVKMSMVGLDVTHEVFMDEAMFRKIKTDCGEIGQFIHQISRVYTGFHREWRNLDGCYVHDASATVYAVAPELFDTESGQLRVSTEGVATGQTIFSKDQQEWFVDHWKDLPLQKVCVDVDGPAVLKLYYQTLRNFTEQT